MGSQIRILAGKYKATHLSAPEGDNTRPTTGRVAENLFNILQHYKFADGRFLDFEGKKILDLCAGSGRLGIEALSRGALRAIFVDTDASARGCIRGNLDKLHLNGVSRIFSRDVKDLGTMPPQAKGPFDIIFCDAPYGKNIPEAALQNAFEHEWIAKGALIIIETEKEKTIPDFSFATLQSEKIYGQTKLHFFENIK